MKENEFQSKLITELKSRFVGCEIIKNDSSYIQGICDLIILYKNKWAMLEVKKSKESKKQPNQEYYVNKFGKMSYAAFIYPENKEKILNELERSLLS